MIKSSCKKSDDNNNPPSTIVTGAEGNVYSFVHFGLMCGRFMMYEIRCMI
jgi:hypothetical protein